MTDSNNNDFKFDEISKEVFSFLGKDYKFYFVDTANWETSKFESKKLTIEIHRFPAHDPKAYFMNVGFDYRGKKMDFADLVSQGNPSLTQNEIEALTASRNYPATTLEDTRNSLFRMAEIVRKLIRN